MLHETEKLVSLRTRLAALILLFASVFSFAQGARIRTAAEEENDRDQPLQRELWNRRGRQVAGKSAAELRGHAYQRKMQRRALRAASGDGNFRLTQAATTAPLTPGSAATTTTTGPKWVALGPAPILSDPTGAQSYGFVSGRATRVLVDQTDVTGNTV